MPPIEGKSKFFCRRLPASQLSPAANEKAGWHSKSRRQALVDAFEG